MNRLWIAFATATWGGLTMLAMSGLSGPDPGLVLSASIGAGIAGAILAPLFARSKVVWAIVTPVLATTLGASLAGAFVTFPTGILAGLQLAPIMVWAAVAQSAPTALVWLAGAFAVRRLAYSLK